MRRIKEKLLDAALAEGLTVELHALNFTPFLVCGAMFDPLALSDGVKRKVIEGIAIAINDHVSCELYNKMPNPLTRRRDKAGEAFGQWHQISCSDERLVSKISTLRRLLNDRITSSGYEVNEVATNGDCTQFKIELRPERGENRYLVVFSEDLERSVDDAVLSSRIVHELTLELGRGDAGSGGPPPKET